MLGQNTRPFAPLPLQSTLGGMGYLESCLPMAEGTPRKWQVAGKAQPDKFSVAGTQVLPRRDR